MDKSKNNLTDSEVGKDGNLEPMLPVVVEPYLVKESLEL